MVFASRVLREHRRGGRMLPRRTSRVRTLASRMAARDRDVMRPGRSIAPRKRSATLSGTPTLSRDRGATDPGRSIAPRKRCATLCDAVIREAPGERCKARASALCCAGNHGDACGHHRDLVAGRDRRPDADGPRIKRRKANSMPAHAASASRRNDGSRTLTSRANRRYPNEERPPDACSTAKPCGGTGMG